MGRSNIYPLEFYISMIFTPLLVSPNSNIEIEIHTKDFVTRQQRTVFRYRNSPVDRFFGLHFTFKALLQLNLSSANLVYLFTQLLLERKILLVSSNYYQNAILIESLLSLLYPLYSFLPT